MAAALPAATPILIDPVSHLPDGAEPGTGWSPSVVATITALARQPAGTGGDRQHREQDVLMPGVELSTWVLPPGQDIPDPGDRGRACGPYQRFLETLDDTTGESLRAAGALLDHLADLLADRTAHCLPDLAPRTDAAGPS